MKMPVLLIVDDEKPTRDALRMGFQDDYEVYTAANLSQASALLQEESPDLVLTDLRLGGESGMDVLKAAASLPHPPQSIMMTAYGTVEKAVEAMQKGAYNYILKPFENDKLVIYVNKAIEMFRQLIKAYPQSPYAAEAKARIAAANQFLSDHEYFVAEFYVRTEKYDQAKVRLKYLLAKYSDQPVAEKARTLLANLEAGNPPRSAITSWIPKFNDSVWPFTGQGAAEISSSD